ncbi:acyltransferase-domain-containing protein [Meredithblackwellia eburnea MCA 4105]
MADRPKGKGKGKVIQLSDAPSGPDDPDGYPLVRDDWERGDRPLSRVSMTSTPFGFTSLEPVVLADVVGTATAEAEERAVVDEPKHKNLFQNNAGRIRDDPIEFAKFLSGYAQGSGWRAYTDYIGPRIMYEGYSAKCIHDLLNSPTVSAKIQELSVQRLATLHLDPSVNKEQKLAELEQQMRDVTYDIAIHLCARMDSAPFLRFFGALVNNILVRMYNQGIHISLDEYKAFRQVAVHAAKKKQTLLILPCHKSHIDYLTISWLFYRLGLSIPHIVAGDNLNMPILGTWLQKCGAFFIRRSFGDDALYPVVVKEYIEQLVENGMNIECFIEGSRSRTGKLLPPKLGILKYVVEAFQKGRTEDVWICPISVQYDKVLETESYLNELLGNPKEKESLTGLLLNTRVIQLKLGRIDVRFKEPFSLKGYIAEQTERRAEMRRRTPGMEFNAKREQDVLLRSLGYQVLSDINKAAVIMPAALVGAVMLTIRGRGVGRNELIKRVSWLRNAIEARGGRVAEFAGMEIPEVVDRALAVLKDVIGHHTDLIEPTFFPISRFELSFYRNQIMHLFVSEAMLAATLYTHVKAGGAAPSQRMQRSKVLSELSFMSRLLQNEFVYGTEGLEANAIATIASLEKDEVILIEGDLIGLSPKERATGRENFDFYCFLLWPFVEVYWLAAVSLFALTPTGEPPSSSETVAWYAEKSFQKSAQALGKALYAQGDVSYLEAINQATLSNAFLRMVEFGVILTRKSSKQKGLPLMALHPDWVPKRSPDGSIAPEGRLWSFLERLGTFRREGKNRRDNSTVSTRVFNHCSAIAPPVLEWTTFSGIAGPASDFWAAKPNL